MGLATDGVGSAGLRQLIAKGGAECTGARGSGAPLGNKNALKHGRFTREKKAQRRRVQELLRQSRKTLADIMKLRKIPTDIME